jgi:hypothetical protein
MTWHFSANPWFSIGSTIPLVNFGSGKENIKPSMVGYEAMIKFDCAYFHKKIMICAKRIQEKISSSESFLNQDHKMKELRKFHFFPLFQVMMMSSEKRCHFYFLPHTERNLTF